MHVHQHQSGDHGDVADAVDEKAPALAQPGDQDARNRRADHASAVEHGRIQGDGVHQVVLADHVHEERLAAGDVEGVHHAQQRREDENVPNLHGMSEGEGRQHKRQQHGCDLGSDDDVLAIAAVGDDAAEGSEEEYGNLAGETYPAQQQSRTGEAVDEPGLGHGLHPGAGEGNELSAEKELEVAMAEGASRGLPAW